MYMKDDDNRIIVEEEKPTKECKHENLTDHYEDVVCNDCGETMQPNTKSMQNNQNLGTILKEADKEFDEKFNYIDGEDFRGWIVDEKENSVHLIDYDNDPNGLKAVKDFLHSQIEIAYKAGQEDKLFLGQIKVAKEVIQREKAQTLKQIEEWADENEKYDDDLDEEVVIIKDLKKFINTL